MSEYYPQNYDQYPSSESPPEKSGKIFWVLILFILVIVGTISWFLFFSNKETIENNSPIENSEGIVESVALCEDWNCFIENSNNCDKSNFTNDSAINFFGALATTTSYYEILGEQNNKCTFKIRTEEQHVNYSAELIQQLLDDGKTQEEIDQQEALSNEQSDLLEGREGTCEFSSQNLANLLTRWSVGNFSGGASCTLGPNGSECTYTGDFEVAENCEGSYFSSEI